MRIIQYSQLSPVALYYERFNDGVGSGDLW